MAAAAAAALDLVTTKYGRTAYVTLMTTTIGASTRAGPIAQNLPEAPEEFMANAGRTTTTEGRTA